MTKSILAITLFCLVHGPVSAQVYTCRDSDGRLYAGDNLQALPESCRAKVQKLLETSADNLNYVPVTGSSQQQSHAFKQEVMRATREIEVRERKEQELLTQAQSVAQQYQQAEKDKWAARKDLTSRSRKIYDEAVEKQQDLLNQKNHILAEVKRGRYSTESRKTIIEILTGIGTK